MISQFQRQSLTVTVQLESFNLSQKAMILRHAQKVAGTLLYIGLFRQKSLPSVLGDLDIKVPMWITQHDPQAVPSTSTFTDLQKALPVDPASESDEDSKADGSFLIYIKTCMSRSQNGQLL